VISPFIEIGQLLTFLYFFIILILFPLIGYIEKHIYYTYVYRFYKKNDIDKKKNIKKENSFLGKIINIFIVYIIYNSINIFYIIIGFIYNNIKNIYMKFRKK
jgi:uncharacterized membrane protein